MCLSLIASPLEQGPITERAGRAFKSGYRLSRLFSQQDGSECSVCVWIFVVDYYAVGDGDLIGVVFNDSESTQPQELPEALLDGVAFQTPGRIMRRILPH